MTHLATGRSPSLDAERDPSAAAVAAGRARIDALDAQIIELVLERARVSGSVQAARLAAGGRRLEHSRELEVVDRYARSLGRRPGASFALTILELCRGQG